MSDAIFDFSSAEKRKEFEKYILRNYRKAMREGWIKPYYQPIISTCTGKICGAEALCRWEDPVFGVISPEKFIPLLENEGCVCDIDMHMLDCVCCDINVFEKEDKETLPISINLSRKDFEVPDLIDKIESLLEKHGIAHELINIEITESAFASREEALSAGIGRLHELGFYICMDDFGTAYSSLAILKDIAFDEIKLDRSFLSAPTEKAKSIIMFVMGMARKIGIHTLAEGVETERQYRFLRDIGCEKIQGYYLGKPMSACSFKQYCEEKFLF